MSFIRQWVTLPTLRTNQLGFRDEPLVDEHNSLLPPDAFHLPVGRPVTHTVYRDAEHAPLEPATQLRQSIRFCTSTDGLLKPAALRPRARR